MSALTILAMLGAAATPPPFDLANHAVVATFHAEGVQIYECKFDEDVWDWVNREPIAALFEDGKTVGRHFAGPRWQLDDGSLIKGKVSESAPAPATTDVNWLKLGVVQNAGTGRLAQVTTVYRINTHGGELPPVGCAPHGALRSMPYTADYVFAR